MILLKKTLLLVLSLCILGYGSAWAFDGHVIKADSNEQPVLVKASAPVSDSHGEKDHGDNNHGSHKICDHCCHISAHIQAIFHRNTGFTPASAAIERLDYSEHFVSCVVSPDLRPPRV